MRQEIYTTPCHGRERTRRSLTEEELARVREVFPDLQTIPVQPHPLSPVL